MCLTALTTELLRFQPATADKWRDAHLELGTVRDRATLTSKSSKPKGHCAP